MKRYRSDIFSFNTLKRTPEVGSLLVALGIGFLLILLVINKAENHV